ncbi:hypothetical protein ACFWY9_04040 [Amycolatopsis sp. NPDC059027]|uniref:hypothetical protein n=1 Tax=Amycolatopsis sp. NPDC059027 TaxID=3346709 RepID=UPI00366EBD32
MTEHWRRYAGSVEAGRMVVASVAVVALAVPQRWTWPSITALALAGAGMLAMVVALLRLLPNRVASVVAAVAWGLAAVAQGIVLWVPDEVRASGSQLVQVRSFGTGLAYAGFGALVLAAALVVASSRAQTGLRDTVVAMLALVSPALLLPLGAVLADDGIGYHIDKAESTVANGPPPRASTPGADAPLGVLKPSAELSVPVTSSAVLVPGTDLMVLIGRPDRYDAVLAYSTGPGGTAQPRWRYSLGQEQSGGARAVVDRAAGRVTVVLRDAVVVLDLASGRELNVVPMPRQAESWSVVGPGQARSGWSPASDVVLRQGPVLLLGALGEEREPEAYVTEFDPGTATFTEFDRGRRGPCAYQAIDDVVLASGPTGCGTPRLTVRTGGGWRMVALPTALTEPVLLGTAKGVILLRGAGELVAIDAKGRQVWHRSVGDAAARAVLTVPEPFVVVQLPGRVVDVIQLRNGAVNREGAALPGDPLGTKDSGPLGEPNGPVVDGAVWYRIATIGGPPEKPDRRVVAVDLRTFTERPLDAGAACCGWGPAGPWLAVLAAADGQLVTKDVAGTHVHRKADQP